MKLKVCGMKYDYNIQKIAELKPDFLGYIFYEKSSRYFVGKIPRLPETVKKVGVFVNSPIEEVLSKVYEHDLNLIQLHGDESPEYCNELKKHSSEDTLRKFEIIKVFSVGNNFDFSLIKDYEDVSNYFLFDTKGKLPGGNGFSFDWQVMKNYPSTKPYFLSGGIGMEQSNALKEFFKMPESKYCFAIDVNSRFEIEPGLKAEDLVREFKEKIISN